MDTDSPQTPRQIREAKRIGKIQAHQSSLGECGLTTNSDWPKQQILKGQDTGRLKQTNANWLFKELNDAGSVKTSQALCGPLHGLFTLLG